VKILFDIGTQSFIKEEDLEENYSLNFYFGFRDNGNLPVYLNNANFGYVLLDQNIEIEKNDNPLNGLVLISTDQNFIFNKKFENLVPLKEYSLIFWSENSNIRKEETFTFILPQPEKPFESWIYNDDLHIWEAPIPRPEGDQIYIWSEKDKKWIKKTSPIIE
jgi:hypothetical protein